MKRLPFKQAAIYAINEVGNPTILATFTSNFTDGVCIRMMGPYMSPMPIGASIAMILSLFGFDHPLFRISFITRKDDQKHKDAEG
jgi:multidrug efflux pump subunit AcrB